MAPDSTRPARYLAVAGLAAAMDMKAATLQQKIWRNPDRPVPVPDAEIYPGHGKGPDRGWLPARIPEWKAWLSSLPGQGAGGGRKPKETRPAT